MALSATERSECSHLNQGSGLVPDYRAYIVGMAGPSIPLAPNFCTTTLTTPAPLRRPNNSFMTTTLSFGTVTDSWVGSPRKRSKAALVGGSRAYPHCAKKRPQRGRAAEAFFLGCAVGGRHGLITRQPGNRSCPNWGHVAWHAYCSLRLPGFQHPTSTCRRRPANILRRGGVVLSGLF